MARPFSNCKEGPVYTDIPVATRHLANYHDSGKLRAGDEQNKCLDGGHGNHTSPAVHARLRERDKGVLGPKANFGMAEEAFQAGDDIALRETAPGVVKDSHMEHASQSAAEMAGPGVLDGILF